MLPISLAVSFTAAADGSAFECLCVSLISNQLAAVPSLRSRGVSEELALADARLSSSDKRMLARSSRAGRIGSSFNKSLSLSLSLEERHNAVWLTGNIRGSDGRCSRVSQAVVAGTRHITGVCKSQQGNKDLSLVP